MRRNPAIEETDQAPAIVHSRAKQDIGEREKKKSNLSSPAHPRSSSMPRPTALEASSLDSQYNESKAKRLEPKRYRIAVLW
jgi:hypothetical protein